MIYDTFEVIWSAGYMHLKYLDVLEAAFRSNKKGRSTGRMRAKKEIGESRRVRGQRSFVTMTGHRSGIKQNVMKL